MSLSQDTGHEESGEAEVPSSSPRLGPSATDGDIKQVLRTIKQIRETMMTPINVGVLTLVHI